MGDESDELIRQNRFRDLLRCVADGNEDASEQIVDEYGSHILRAVRRRMNRAIRDRFDSEDFAQAVWASFFGHISVVERIGSEGELAGFLCRMASNKVIDAGRRQQSRNEPTSNSEQLPAVDKDHRLRFSQPTPSQFAVANEQWDKLTGDEQGRDLRLLELRRDGATQAEIAASMGVSERHVRRILTRIARKNNSDVESATS